MELLIDTAGQIRCLYDECLDLSALGQVHIERNTLVLGFLDCVPAPQARDLRVRIFEYCGICQKFVRHYCRQVFVSYRSSKLAPFGQIVLHPCQPVSQTFFERVEVVSSSSAQGLVVVLVLKAVNRFLTLECRNFLDEPFVIDLVAVRPDRFNEEFFPNRKQAGHSVKKRRTECAATVPIRLKGLLNRECWSAR